MSETWEPDVVSKAWFKRVTEGAGAVMLAGIDRYLSNRPWPEVLVFGLGAYCILLFLTDRFWKPSLRRQIRDWLDSSGYSVETKRNDAWEFGFVATLNGWMAVVFKGKDSLHPPEVVVASSVVVPDDFRKALGELKGDQRTSFLRPLEQELYRYEVNFDFKEFASANSVVSVSEVIVVTD